MRYLLLVIGALLVVATTSQAKIIRLPSVTVASVVVGAELSTSVSLTVTDQLIPDSKILSVEIMSEGSTPVFRALQNTFRDSITIGKPFPVNVAFFPNAVGEHSETLVLLVGSKQQSDTVLVPVSGRGLPLRVAPKKLDFGTVEQGKTQEKFFAVFNDGAEVVRVQLGNIEPPFRFSKGQAGQVLLVAARNFVEVAVECVADKLPGVYRGQIFLTTGSGNTVGVSDSVELLVTVREQSREIDLLFGSVVIGTSREMSYVLQNPLNEQVSVAVGDIKGGGAFEFVPPRRKEIVVPANGSATIPLRFTPQGTGTATPAQFSISSNVPKFTPATVHLQGSGVDIGGISIRASVVRANVGDVVLLPIFTTVSADVTSEFLRSNVDSMECSFDIVMNASVAYITTVLPVDSVYFDTGELVASVRTMVHFARDNTNGEWLVASIPLRILLGDATSTPIKLRNVLWSYERTVIARKSEALEGEGKLVIDDIFTWPNGERRLIATRRGPLELAIAPNPMGQEATIDARGFSGRAIVSIYTPLGEKVFTKTIEKPSSFTFSRSGIQGIGPGLYYCRLSAGRYSLVKLLRVE